MKLLPWQRVVLALSGVLLGLANPAPALAETYVPINGAGSSWAANAVNQWISAVHQSGMRVDYSANGSSDGRQRFLQHTVDYAASDIPFQQHPTDGGSPENPAPGTYAYMPIVAGGTSFMYNLRIGGRQVTNLRLSGEVVAKIFTGGITRWDDQAIKNDNPGLTMPASKIVPVIRSDGSGSSAQFSLWMQAQQSGIWSEFCRQRGCGNGAASYWPNFPGAVSKAGDLGVASYVAQGYSEGAIGYVQYSYAINAGFPVVKLLNAAGYYVEPTPLNVAVALLKAKISENPDPAVYLTQDLTDVYKYEDPRVYPMSSYSYFILPTTVTGNFSEAKGKTLAAFSSYFECEGQQQAPDLGYSPLPRNLVEASFKQIAKIPGAQPPSKPLESCNNPTFTPDGHNRLADVAPQPQACDKRGPGQCTTGTGGKKNQPTPVNAGAQSANQAAGGGQGGGQSGQNGQNGGPGATGSAGTGGPSAAPSLSYDPATDQYVGAGGGSGGGGDPGVGAVPIAMPTGEGWTAAQTLMLIAGLATLALVLGPGLVSWMLRRRQ
ncbi:phosphate ABC transporter substrate-binding protein PstS [Dactylosporangium sp. NPDC000555]|uniref:phosphate ABC transporter substrate-binding protein PstS n=1 Tax=Dactylosporangium sp. NPDC000555 TaxID=3154260 RepID=UPI00332681B4